MNSVMQLTNNYFVSYLPDYGYMLRRNMLHWTIQYTAVISTCYEAYVFINGSLVTLSLALNGRIVSE